MHHILICDDLPDVLGSLRILLKTAGYRVSVASSAEECLRAVARGDIDLVLTDMNFDADTTSGSEGLRLVTDLVRLPDPPPVMVMTGYAAITLAVQAMQQGAVDFIPKPWDNSTLLTSVAAAIERRRATRSELSSAHQVQLKLLADQQVQGDGWRVRAHFRPARSVSGDYYDVFPLPDGVAIVLADVSGKGIPAALLMANLQATLRAQPTNLLAQPEQLIHRINGLFCASTRPEHYATLFYAVFHRSTRTLHYVNCGHPAATFADQDLASTGFPIGLFPQWRGHAGSVPTAPHQVLHCVTDGITEADLTDDDQTEIWLELES